jgi:two-component system OmpR family response regulator
MVRILVAEDDRSVCEMLELFMKREGFDVTFVHDGEKALDEWRKGGYDLLVLDWMLPKVDGVRVCRKVRETSDVPILLLTARTGESDQVLGLEMGADDYVTKPFSPLALMARIKALLRRAGRNPTVAGPADTPPGQRLTLDEETREVRIDGERVSGITPKEFELLRLFVRHPRRVFTREELLERVWGYDWYGDERTVDAHIKRLRKKIDRPGASWIRTVWGVGYKFVEDGEDESV